MGWMCGHWLRRGILGVASSVLLVGVASAEITTERSASILVFPKVLFDGTFDTIIQISNTSNSLVYAHCFYVNNADEECQEVDFDIMLTRQQPTHWVVSLGRTTDPFSPACSNTSQDCNDAGIDPGRVPPVADGFVGELKCIEVDQSGAPISGNHLKGEATIISTASVDDVSTEKDASKYNAAGIVGLDTNDSNTVLCLGGGASGDCPGGAEYEGCPNVTLLNHHAEGSTHPIAEEGGSGGSVVATEITVVPCTENFETQEPTATVVQFEIYNEFEEKSSTSTTVECWDTFRLESINPIFGVGSQFTRYVQTRMRPAGNNAGFVVVQEEFVTDESQTIRSAWNPHIVGERAAGDIVTVPEGP